MGAGQGSATTLVTVKGKHTRITDWLGELPRKYFRNPHSGGTLIRGLCDQWALEMDAGTDDVRTTNISPETQPSKLPPPFTYSENESEQLKTNCSDDNPGFSARGCHQDCCESWASTSAKQMEEGLMGGVCIGCVRPLHRFPYCIPKLAYHVTLSRPGVVTHLPSRHSGGGDPC